MGDTNESVDKKNKVSCMRCTRMFTLDYEIERCCDSESEARHNMCGCKGMSEPIMCIECWKELEG